MTTKTTTKTTKRFLPYYVYRSALGDCTNGGVSAQAKEIYVECPGGNWSEDDLRAKGLAHLMFRIERVGSYLRAVPLVPPRTGYAGPMAGGNLAATCDSRGEGVLHIHDRYDTWAQYDHLST